MFIKDGWKCCEEYDGTLKTIETMPGFKHQAKAVCAHCNHFIRWLPNPKTKELTSQINAKIKEILEHTDNLQSCEISFVNDMVDKKKLTKKQQQVFDTLYNRIIHPELVVVENVENIVEQPKVPDVTEKKKRGRPKKVLV